MIRSEERRIRKPRETQSDLRNRKAHDATLRKMERERGRERERDRERGRERERRDCALNRETEIYERV
jgi:hypothetical protein